MHAPPPKTLSPFFIGDHPAIDFCNTVARVNDQTVDFFQTDTDVLHWLAHYQWPSISSAKSLHGQLVESARTLREAIRVLVTARKKGRRSDPATLNDFLRAGASYAEIDWTAGANPQLVRRQDKRTSDALLAPVAESAAELLCTGNFELVRPCANPDCVLWFYDRTKAHRRRWCSMAACGNRHKVAAFRQRL